MTAAPSRPSPPAHVRARGLWNLLNLATPLGLVAAVVACLRPARLVTFDDVDATLTLDELAALHAALDVLKDHGHPFAVSAVASAPVPRDAVVLTLPPVREN